MKMFIFYIPGQESIFVLKYSYANGQRNNVKKVYKILIALNRAIKPSSRTDISLVVWKQNNVARFVGYSTGRVHSLNFDVNEHHCNHKTRVSPKNSNNEGNSIVLGVVKA